MPPLLFYLLMLSLNISKKVGANVTKVAKRIGYDRFKTNRCLP